MKSLIILLFSLNAYAVNPIDQWGYDNLTWENTAIADTTSDILYVGLLASPVVYAGVKHEWTKMGVSVAILGVNHWVTSGLKGWIGRDRPDHSEFRSMPSGHTSGSFTGAGLLCAISQDPAICTTGFVLAGTVAYLRVAAKKHWITDVLAGASLGIINGVVFPTVVLKW